MYELVLDLKLYLLQGTLAGGTFQGTSRPRYLQGTLSSKVPYKVHYKVPSRYLGAQCTFEVPCVGVCCDLKSLEGAFKDKASLQ